MLRVVIFFIHSFARSFLLFFLVLRSLAHPPFYCLPYLCYLVCSHAHTRRRATFRRATIFWMFPYLVSFLSRLIFEFRDSANSTCLGHSRAGQSLRTYLADIRDEENLISCLRYSKRIYVCVGVKISRNILLHFLPTCRALFLRLCRPSLCFLFRSIFIH